MKAPNKTSASLVDVVYYNIIVQSVLDLSKVLIYEFYYEYVIPKVGKKNGNPIYMDTDKDSLIPLIKQITFMKMLVIMLKNKKLNYNI